MTHEEELAVIDSPPRPETPSAHDVREMMRSQNVRFSIGAVVILLGLAVVVWFAASSRAASLDSNNSTQVQLASQERDDCILDRRNAQSEALGRFQAAASDAEAAGLLDRDVARARRFRELYNDAVHDWQEATESLADDVLNRPTDEGGCGPPILTLDDLPKDG